MGAEHVVAIVTRDEFAALLGAELVEQEPDRVVLRLPYRKALGSGRIHGGAISTLVDVAATASFWSHPTLPQNARGATVAFTINFLTIAAAGNDLVATATVRRRGGTLCTGNVSVTDPEGVEVATAVVIYKLDRGSLDQGE